MGLTREAGEGAPRFERRAPPDDHPLQLAMQPLALRRGAL
jgi:hypothetical protein